MSDQDQTSETEDFFSEDRSEEVDTQENLDSATESTSFVQPAQPSQHTATNDLRHARVPRGVFDFGKLPPELKRHILSYLLPQNLSFKFVPISFHGWQPRREREWNVQAREKGSTDPFLTVINRDVDISRFDPPKTLENPLSMYSTLLCVKAIAEEARAIFFDLNEFTVYHRYTENFAEKFGPLGLHRRLHTVRDIRNLRIVPGLPMSGSSCRHLRNDLQRLVTELTKDADVGDSKSLLKQLTICTGDLDYRRHDEQKKEDALRAEKYLFALEPLIALRLALEIQDVTVTGVPSWFTRCLEMYIRGDGGEVNKVDWPTTTIERRFKKRPLKREVVVSSKTWQQPVYDWREFAERNGIELPEDVGRFWQVRELEASLLNPQ